MSMHYTVFDSPVGSLTLAGPASGPVQRLSRLAFGQVGEVSWTRDDDRFGQIRAQLAEYFRGDRQTFDVELELDGTDWELRVWAVLRSIPYGETWTYGEVATVACPETRARAARAVGRANHANPVAIIVPCHRVIGANRKLVGFGGGLETKRALLDLEAGRLPLGSARMGPAGP